jgi:hypothetical protein
MSWSAITPVKWSWQGGFGIEMEGSNMADQSMAVADRRYAISPRALCRVIHDEAVALDLDAGQYYGLNAVATRVWQLLGEGHSVSAINAKLLEEFDVEHGVLRADIDSFIGDLEARGLVIAKEAE